MTKPPDQEIEKRRDDALRRALTTPPKPHKPAPKPAKRKPDERNSSAAETGDG